MFLNFDIISPLPRHYVAHRYTFVKKTTDVYIDKNTFMQMNF